MTMMFKMQENRMQHFHLLLQKAQSKKKFFKSGKQQLYLSLVFKNVAKAE